MQLTQDDRGIEIKNTPLIRPFDPAMHAVEEIRCIRSTGERRARTTRVDWDVYRWSSRSDRDVLTTTLSDRDSFAGGSDGRSSNRRDTIGDRNTDGCSGDGFRVRDRSFYETRNAERGGIGGAVRNINADFSADDLLG
jgi:hypothetical protein